MRGPVGCGGGDLNRARGASLVIQGGTVREDDVVARHRERGGIRAAGDGIGRSAAISDGQRRRRGASRAVFGNRARLVDRQAVDEVRGRQLAVVELEPFDVGHGVVAVRPRNSIA